MIWYYISRKCKVSFLCRGSSKSCVINTNKSRTFSSLYMWRSLFCKLFSPLIINEGTSGICKSCLRRTIISSTIYFCFSFSSFSLSTLRISMSWSIRVPMALGAKKCNLLKWRALNISIRVFSLHSLCGSSVSYTRSINVRNESFLSLVWKRKRGKRSFFNVFHLPSVYLTNGSEWFSYFTSFIISLRQSSHPSFFT